jgi:hypothetical protein
MLADEPKSVSLSVRGADARAPAHPTPWANIGGKSRFAPPRHRVSLLPRLQFRPGYNPPANRNPFGASMPTERTWLQWLERFCSLRRDKRGSHERPHKPVVFLAILDLLDCGLILK